MCGNVIEEETWGMGGTCLASLIVHTALHKLLLMLYNTY